MRTKKPFKDLILSDNFMFGEVMRDERICRQFLSEVLKKDIVDLNITAKEFVLDSMYGSHGVRLDIIARDAAGNIYDVEMQNPNKHDIERRSRYYIGNIDKENFPRGKKDYNDLHDCYVIFICTFDHVGAGYAYYEKTSIYNKDLNMPCEDGAHLIILNSEYDREKKNIELPIEEFLSIIKGVESNYSSMLARDVSERIVEIKKNHEMEVSYMTLDELLQDERDEGRAEGKAEGIELGRSEGLAEGMEKGAAQVLKILGVSEEEYQKILQRNAEQKV